MFKPLPTLTIICLFFCFSQMSIAYWPTTVRDNLYISNGAFPSAIAFPGGKTLVVHRWEIGNCFNIIDKYGEFQFPGPQTLTPAISWFAYWDAKMISDGESGAIVCWSTMGGTPIEGIVTQRLDSLGNLMWGDSGKVVFPIEETDFDICTDGAGGFFLAISPDEEAMDHSDLYMQRVDSEGNLPWGQEGVLISDLPSESERYPKVAYCGLGGVYVIWEDHRPPYNIWGALFAQRIDGNGNILWTNDLFICEHVWFHQVIPDGEGGFLLHTNPGTSEQNTVFRVSSSGNILWEREDVSWYPSAMMIPGDNTYFYLTWAYDHGYYAQKMDMNGNTYWPAYGSLQGVLMSYFSNYIADSRKGYFYKAPYFYGIHSYRINGDYPRIELAQKLNSNGLPLWGDNGVLMTSVNDGNYQHVNAVYDGTDGMILVYEKYSDYDIWAKRVNNYGILGGALHLWIDMEPQNPPIQIPPNGGSFQFNVAIEDTYVVESVFDAWIEVTLPNDEELEILHRDDIFIHPNSIMQRPDMIQSVPAHAPAGNYVYHLYVGNHEHDDIWSEDSFGFVKLP